MRVNAIQLATVSIVVALAGCSSVYLSPDGHGGPELQAGVDFDKSVAMAGELRYADAAKQFVRLERVFAAVGDESRAARCAFWLAFCTEKQALAARATNTYRRIIRQYPGTPESRQAARRLSRMTDRAAEQDE